MPCDDHGPDLKDEAGPVLDPFRRQMEQRLRDPDQRQQVVAMLLCFSLIGGSSLPGIRILIHPDIICFPNASIDIYRVRNDLIRKRRSVLWKEDIFVCRDLDRVGSKRSRFDRR